MSLIKVKNEIDNAGGGSDREAETITIGRNSSGKITSIIEQFAAKQVTTNFAKNGSTGIITETTKDASGTSTQSVWKTTINPNSATVERIS
jgi:hypothetical protein